MRSDADKFVGVAAMGFFGILVAVVAGAFIGDAIPHEHHGRLDPFVNTAASVAVFLAGTGLGMWRRLRLVELWVSLALVQLTVLLIVGYFTGFTSIFGWWFFYASLHVSLPFLLALVVLYAISFTRRKT